MGPSKQERSNLGRLLAGESLPITIPERGPQIADSLVAITAPFSVGARIGPPRPTRSPSDDIRDRGLGHLPSKLQSSSETSSSGVRLAQIPPHTMAAMLERASGTSRHGLALDDLVTLADVVAASDSHRLATSWQRAIDAGNTFVAVAIAMVLPVILANGDRDVRRAVVNRFLRSLQLANAYDQKHSDAPPRANLRRSLVKALLVAETARPDDRALITAIARECRDLLVGDPIAARSFARYW